VTDINSLTFGEIVSARHGLINRQLL